jgi:hypothetical protein
MTPKLVCSRNFDPAVFMGDGWSVAEEDDRANDLTVIDPPAITLLTCLEKEEQQPTGERCLKLLKEMPHVRLGGRAFLALWENQRAIPATWKERLTFVFFDGLVLGHRNGNRYSLYLSWHDDAWHWYSGWLGNTRSASSRSAVIANVSSNRESHR